jgi:hypothetical protein
MSIGLEKVKAFFRRAAASEEELVHGGEPVATPPPGAASEQTDDPDRETSTNAQLEGAAGEPWGGSR